MLINNKSIVNVQKSFLTEDQINKINKIDQIEKNTNLFSDLIIPCTVNLFNKDTISRNAYYDTEGNPTINSMIYALSDFIELTQGLSYYCSLTSGYVFKFDKDKKYIEKRWISYPYICEDNVSYIRFQLNSQTEIEETMFVKGEKSPAEYYPYLCYTTNKELLKDIGNSSSSSSVLENMVIDFVGDSMTVQSTFINYMISNYNIIANKYCGNGNTMMKNGIVSLRLTAADTSADAIVILGGTNDAYFGAVGENDYGNYPIGELGDTTTDTFCGAIDTMCKYLLKNFKGKRILICSSPIRYDTVNGVNLRDRLEEYVNAEKKVVEYYGLPFLDFFHEYAHYTITSDGLHPTVDSGKLLGRVMAKKLEAM